MIVIPDIHGRRFWQEGVQSARPGEMVVFLGDYLEPYTEYEGITHDAAYGNFLEILDYARAHPDTCRLLLGNHDFACIYPEMISCRHDYLHEERNRKAFTDNFHLFSLVYEAPPSTPEGLPVVCSHAGIHRRWFEKSVFCPGCGNGDGGGFGSDGFGDGGSGYGGCSDSSGSEGYCDYCDGYRDEDVPRLINETFLRDPRACIPSLKVCSMLRGWTRERFGSIVWADIREWFYRPDQIPRAEKRHNLTPFPFFQVFGHSQSDKPVRTPSLAMIDCRRSFRF